MQKDKNVLMGTPATRIDDPVKLKNPNVVKVVLDKNDFALYFSRHPIPYIRDDLTFSRGKLAELDLRRFSFYEHIGIYVFRRDFLMKFSSWKQTPLEKLERLEQLRVLENGYKIKVYLTQEKIKTVDAPADLKKLTSPKGGVVR
jgi:3-deoxy-manno-octulosonate cytidylyltransferase (CMP-KDO synthetase)